MCDIRFIESTQKSIMVSPNKSRPLAGLSASDQAETESQMASMQAKIEAQNNEVANLKSGHDAEVANLKSSHEAEVASLRARHYAEVADLRSKLDEAHRMLSQQVCSCIGWQILLFD